jgi:hypothetical protein
LPLSIGPMDFSPIVAVIALAALWLHAIGVRGRRRAPRLIVDALARGALVAALILTLAGVTPTDEGLDPLWLLALGVLLGLAESSVDRSPAGSDEHAKMKPQVRVEES